MELYRLTGETVDAELKMEFEYAGIDLKIIQYEAPYSGQIKRLAVAYGDCELLNSNRFFDDLEVFKKYVTDMWEQNGVTKKHILTFYNNQI